MLLAQATSEMEARRRLVEGQSQFANQRLARLEQIVADANRANRELEARLQAVTQEKRLLEKQALREREAGQGGSRSRRRPRRSTAGARPRLPPQTRRRRSSRERAAARAAREKARAGGTRARRRAAAGRAGRGARRAKAAKGPRRRPPSRCCERTRIGLGGSSPRSGSGSSARPSGSQAELAAARGEESSSWDAVPGEVEPSRGSGSRVCRRTRPGCRPSFSTGARDAAPGAWRV